MIFRCATLRLALLGCVLAPAARATPAGGPVIMEDEDPAVGWTFERAAAELVRAPSGEDEFERIAIDGNLSRSAIPPARHRWLASEGPPPVEPEHLIRMLSANAQSMWAGHTIAEHRVWQVSEGVPVLIPRPQARAELLWMGDRFVSRVVDLADDRAGPPLTIRPHEVWSDGLSLWLGGPSSGRLGRTIRAPLLARHLVRSRFDSKHLAAMAMMCDVPRWILDSEGPEGQSRPVSSLAAHLAWRAESRGIVVLPRTGTIDGRRTIIVTGVDGEGDRFVLAPSLNFAALRSERVLRRFEDGRYVGTVVLSVTVYRDHVEAAPGIFLPREVTTIVDLGALERRGPARGGQSLQERSLRITHASVVHLSINEPLLPVLLEPRVEGLMHDELHGGTTWALDASGRASVEAALRMGIEEAGRRVPDQKTARRANGAGLSIADASIAAVIALAMVLLFGHAARRRRVAARRAGRVGRAPSDAITSPFFPAIVCAWLLLSQAGSEVEATTDGFADPALKESAAAARACSIVASFGAAQVLGVRDVTLRDIAASLDWAPGRAVRTDRLVDHLASFGHARVVHVRESDRESWLQEHPRDGARLLLFPPSGTEDGHVALALGMTPQRDILLLDYPSILTAIPVTELAAAWSGSAIEVSSTDTSGPAHRSVTLPRFPLTTVAVAACPFALLIFRRGTRS